ncbi:MAG: insulinase family protein [Polyangiaceae bacterium]|nr:insulinase family protein [Polyangiaceae bacterium]
MTSPPNLRATSRVALVAALAASAACARSVPPATTTAPRATASASARPDPEPWRAEIPAPGAPGDLAFPAPEVKVLPNGLTLIVIRRALPVVTLTVAVRHGASSVPEGRTGLAAVTARMLVEGTIRRRSTDLARATENLGSVLDSDAGRDYSYVNLTVLPEDLPAGLSLVSEVVREPAFDSREFQRVRSEWLSSLTEERQDPSRLAAIAGLRLLAGPVLGAPVSGGVPDVERLAVEDVTSFWKGSYQPNAAALVVVGMVGMPEIEPLAQTSLGAWRGAAPAPAPPPAPNVGAPTRIFLVDRPDSVQSALFVAQPMPPRSAPGYEGRLVMNAVLGGLFTSRLNTNLREVHAYTYGVSSSLVATRSWGGWIAATTVETTATAPALREIVSELAAVTGPAPARPFTSLEVERAKAALVHAQAAHLADARDVAYDLLAAFVQDLPLDYPARYSRAVGAVTPDEARRAAAEHLTPDQLIVVVVGDRRRIEGDLRASWGRVETAHPSLCE